jgi:hypothetical protein
LGDALTEFLNLAEALGFDPARAISAVKKVSSPSGIDRGEQASGGNLVIDSLGSIAIDIGNGVVFFFRSNDARRDSDQSGQRTFPKGIRWGSASGDMPTM